MLRSEIRAAEYRAKALEASTLAQASVLRRVRDRHRLAAAAWTDLASAEDQRTLSLSTDLR
jgi:hypothetical protein